MLYNSLKIFHIISATLFLMSVSYSYYLWHNIQKIEDAAILSYRIQKQTLLSIVPLALAQLATGFTMISLKQEDFSELWVIGSIIGFVVVIGSWFSFLYFILLSQQLSSDSTNQTTLKARFFRRIQSFMLMVCGIALLCMIFFMANKIA